MQVAGATLGGLVTARHSALAQPMTPFDVWLRSSQFEDFVIQTVTTAHVPATSIAVVGDGRVILSKGYGIADIAAKRRMTSRTVINIASVTKTITCTAIMQLFEQGRFKLDDDVNAFLPFRVRNPAFSAKPITFRQLLLHTSSIDDGPDYGSSCGDSDVTMAAWVRDELTTSRATRNFLPVPPGDKYHYSNIAYGVLGVLIESISGKSFAEYCDRNIFKPLGMNRTGFLLKTLDPRTEAIPYDYTDHPEAVPVRKAGFSSAPVNGKIQVPHCFYSFATQSDGLARSCADDLASFLAMYLGDGAFRGVRILRPETIRLILSDSEPAIHPSESQTQGLAWVEYRGGIWGKYGADPGVATLIKFRPSDKRGIVILTNSNQGEHVTNAIAGKIFAFGS